jgi:hypothetical protein
VQRERENEPRAASRLVFCPDTTAVRFDNAFANRQP